MASPQEGPNPLRPYYIPPSIGTSTEPLTSNASATTAKSAGASSPSFSLHDFDYTDYLSEASPSTTASIKKLIDSAIWKYTSVLMAQPFDVAKLILQVHVAQDDEVNGQVVPEERQRGAIRSQEEDDDEYANSSDDEPNYFTSSAPSDHISSGRSPTRGRPGRPPRHIVNRSAYIPSTSSTSSPHRLPMKNSHSLRDALAALSSTTGALSLWRATNTTFVYNILLRTLETFFRSLLAAIMGISDADILIPSPSGAIPSSSVLTSTTPAATLFIATAASAISSLILAPIDASRTRLILTPSSQPPRSLLATLRTLPMPYVIPGHLIPITFLTSTLPTLISTSTPLFLKNYLNLDPMLNPGSWSIATFAGASIDLAVKFPLETVLRRAQIATWTSPALSPPSSSSARKAVATIVPVPQVYRGVLPTMWGIVREEGTSVSPKDIAVASLGKAPRRRRKGQGVEGLYRGWRVGVWGLVGVWGASFIGGLQTGVEAAEEGSAPHGGKF